MDSASSILNVQTELPQPWSLNGFSEDLTEAFQLELQAARGSVENRFSETSSDDSNELEEPLKTLISSEGYEKRSGSGIGLTVTSITVIPTIPEYPETSTSGICYVIPVNTISESLLKAPWNQIQYCKKRLVAPKQSSSAFLNNAICTHVTYGCTGVKACQYIDNAIETLHHSAISDSLWTTIQQIRNARESHSGSKAAIAWARAFLDAHKKRLSCISYIDSCSVKIVQNAFGTISGAPQYFVQCVNYNSQFNPGHHNTIIPLQFSSFIPLIQSLFLHGTTPSNLHETCYVVDSTRRIGKKCDCAHPQGHGSMITLPRNSSCSARWTFYTPLNLESVPYLLLICHDTHSHPPPPPKQTPKDLIQGLLDVLQKINDPAITLTSFLRSPQLQEFCHQYNGMNLGAIHQSLANSDRIRLIIQKHKALYYPLGSSRLAVAYEWQLKHQNAEHPYIQHFQDDGTNFLIICFYQEQVELFQKQHIHSFELDMNYKHLSERNHREVIWGYYSPQTCRAIPLVRVLTNSESPQMYYVMFLTVFQLFVTRFSFRVKWHHIDGEGLYGITIDQDYSAILGFTAYLSQHVDSNHRSWLYHAKNSIRLCHIHFQRGVEKLAGQSRQPNGLRDRMMQLLHCRSEDDYIRLCELLEQEPTPGVREWALHKKRIAIRAGLNKACSSIPACHWDDMRSHTNTVEVLHEQGYKWSGRYANLLHVVRKNADLDQLIIEQDQTFHQYGIRFRYRGTSLTARFAEAISRDKTRRKHQLERAEETQLLSSSPVSASEEASDSESLRSVSSSGVSRSSKRSRRTRHTPLLRRSTQNLASQNQLDREKELQLREREIQLQEQELSIQEKKLQLRERELALRRQEKDLE